MNDFPRYTRIKEEMHKELQAKTGYRRNEIEALLALVLSRVADQEISWLRAVPQSWDDPTDDSLEEEYDDIPY